MGDVPTVYVEHGCETGCCGHRIVDTADPYGPSLAWTFDHPMRGEPHRRFVGRVLRENLGCRVRVDWGACVIDC